MIRLFIIAVLGGVLGGVIGSALLFIGGHIAKERAEIKATEANRDGEIFLILKADCTKKFAAASNKEYWPIINCDDVLTKRFIDLSPNI